MRDVLGDDIARPGNRASTVQRRRKRAVRGLGTFEKITLGQARQFTHNIEVSAELVLVAHVVDRVRRVHVGVRRLANLLEHAAHCDVAARDINLALQHSNTVLLALFDHLPRLDEQLALQASGQHWQVLEQTY